MAAKIKDGLFIGDVETSQDPEFLELNKISNMVNLSGRENANVWSAHGIVYLTLNWEDKPDFILFPERERSDILDDLCDFIDGSLYHGISVLLFSTRGTGRCAVAACAYLMCKYCWSFEKAFEYVQCKKPDIELSRGFVIQMRALDKHLQKLRLRAFPQLATMDHLLHARLNDWNTSYLEDATFMSSFSWSTANEEPAMMTPSLRQRECRGGIGLHSDVEEERLLIHSHINGKQYLRKLPGPYSAADMGERKQNKLRFHARERRYEDEEGAHPEGAPDHRKKAVRGALKGSRERHQRILIEMQQREKELQQQQQQQHQHTLRLHHYSQCLCLSLSLWMLMLMQKLTQGEW